MKWGQLVFLFFIGALIIGAGLIGYKSTTPSEG